jgi:hypothetical protein
MNDIQTAPRLPRFWNSDLDRTMNLARRMGMVLRAACCAGQRRDLGGMFALYKSRTARPVVVSDDLQDVRYYLRRGR